MLLVLELALQLALRVGWKSYRGFDTISAVAVDGKGQAWVSGFWRERPGLMIYSEAGQTVEVSLPADLGWGAINTLMIDGQDRVWLGTDGGRIAMLDSNGGWIVYSGNTEESIWQIVMDGQGQVWARSHRGPARIDPDSDERTFTFTDPALADHDAAALAINPQGQLWVLTRQRELRVLEVDGNWRTVALAPATVRNGFADAFLTFDPQGQMWLATVQGVGALSPDGAWKEHPLGDPYSPLSLHEVSADARGRVWVAAFQPRYNNAEAFSGVFLFDPQAGWTNYSTKNSGLRSDINALALDPQGQVWMGSTQGSVTKFDPAASLPAAILPAVRLGTQALLPGVLISLLLLAILATVQGRPDAGIARQITEFSLGFVTWYAIALLVWGFLRYSHVQSSSLLFFNPLAVLVPVVNLVLMILLYTKRRGMARGAVWAMVINSMGMLFMVPIGVQWVSTSLFAAVFMMPFFLLG
jgi:ligand-binding sensor domain-containing protein